MSLRYRGADLYFGKAEGLKLQELAERYPTPFYLYDLDSIHARLEHLIDSFSVPADVHYAMKANAHPALLRMFAESGVGVDVVSGGEIRNALNAGFSADRIIFSGVGKTLAEIEQAVKIGIKQINVESAQELERIAAVAAAAGKRARVAFRVNPDVDVNTHPYITTGFRENKFGVDPASLPELEAILARSPSLELVGLTLHIGSQLRELEAIRSAIEKTIPLFLALRGRGHTLTTFDVGGGLGIDYKDIHHEADYPLMTEYGAMVSKLLKPLGVRVLLEPGRILVGGSGVLICEVQYVKQTPHKKFLITNTGIHHLLRPALYQAHHGIYALVKNDARPRQEYDVVGPICESSDTIGKARVMPEVRQGEFLAIADVGAYGYTMATIYNEHNPPEQYVIHGNTLQQNHPR